jgi:hypothetical protein
MVDDWSVGMLVIKIMFACMSVKPNIPAFHSSMHPMTQRGGKI